MSKKFILGHVVVTNRAAEILAAADWSVESLLDRHLAGDWGDVSDDQKRINDDCVDREFSIISSYATPDGQSVTVFTMADRSRTLVHLAQPTHSRTSVG